MQVRDGTWRLLPVGLRRAGAAVGPQMRRHWIVTSVLLVLLALVVLADRLIDRPMRSWIERAANERLDGYSIAIGDADFRPWVLSGRIFDIVVVQDAHPKPPVARITESSIDIDWGALLRGRLVADLEVLEPVIYINTQQLSEEWSDEVPLKDRGWQRLWELYPLKVNHFEVTGGRVTYLDSAARRELRLSDLNVIASNIRHVTDPDAAYPSPVEARAVVFDEGRLELSGHADLLRRPHAALNVVADVTGLPLAALGTVVDDYRIRLRGGVLGARGQFEVTPERYIANLDRLAIDALRVDYLAGANTPRIVRARRAIAEAARYADRSPSVRLRARQLAVNGSFGYVSDTRPRYRVFLDDARLRLTNFSNRAEQGESRLALNGQFMGEGPARLRGVLRPGPGRANFAINAEIGSTDLRALNDVLRAHGKLDVSAGTLALYSQLQVRNGQVRGYVKPLLKDVDVHDDEADKNDNVFRRLYEMIVEEIAEILENTPRDEVVTIVDLSGPLDDPDASIGQIAGTLLRNAFVRAILPGFEPGHAPPAAKPPAQKPDAPKQKPGEKKPSADAAPPARPRTPATRHYAEAPTSRRMASASDTADSS